MRSIRLFNRKTAIGLVLALAVAMVVPQQVAGADLGSEMGPQRIYFAGVCACIFGETVYRTQFEFMNEVDSPDGVPDSPLSATLTFFQSDGSPMEVTAAPVWVGMEGTVESNGNAISFSLPNRSTLVLPLVPQEDAGLGWAELKADGPINPQATLQLAKMDTKGEGSTFEEGLLHQANLYPSYASKNFVLPVSLFSGMKRLGTAFTLANLSGVPSKVELTLRPGNTREITLGPGEMLADYFQHFWAIAFPAIFPLDYRGTAEIKSSGPLTLGAFRTMNGYPNLGVRPAAGTSEDQAPDLEAMLDTPFELAAGQMAEVNGARIEFWDVSEDSRCPTDAQCIWEGRVRIEVRLSGSDSKVIASLSPVKGEDSISYGGIQFRLLEVSPEPVSTETLELSDYRIQLIATED